MSFTVFHRAERTAANFFILLLRFAYTGIPKNKSFLLYFYCILFMLSHTCEPRRLQVEVVEVWLRTLVRTSSGRVVALQVIQCG